MGLFECQVCANLRRENTALRAEISDKSEFLLKILKAKEESEQKLIEKLIAVTNPLALREIRGEKPAVAPSGPPPRPNFPGFRPDLRPPVIQKTESK